MRQAVRAIPVGTSAYAPSLRVATSHHDFHPAPTPPRGRTWAPLRQTSDGNRHVRTTSSPAHSLGRSPTCATRHLGRAVFGHGPRSVHLAPLASAGPNARGLPAREPPARRAGARPRPPPPPPAGGGGGGARRAR